MRCRRIEREGPPAARGGQLHALVRLVVDKAPVGEPLHRGGDRARGQAEAVGQDPGMGVAVARKPVDGLQRLAIGFGQGVHVGFDG